MPWDLLAFRGFSALQESLRKQLRWEVTPVVTDFDPRFNNAKPLWFEKLYQPFLREKQNFEDN